jgi:LEA14-like dessication related protein
MDMKLILKSRFLIAAIAVALMIGCASLVGSLVEEPKVSFAGLAIREAKPEGATAVITLRIENPNGVRLTVDNLEYNLELGGHKVAEAQIEKITAIEAHATSNVEIPVPFRYDQVFASILDLISKGTAVYKVNGSARIGFFTLPFDHTGEVKLRD